jgi:Protein of unknown function (DUF559)
MRRFKGGCLVDDTPILLHTLGTSRSNQDLFEENYTGPIVSWDRERGTVMSHVLSVKRMPIGTPLVRVITHQRGYALDGSRLGPLTEQVRYGHRILVCADDLPIWTERGWIPARKLQAGVVVKHETAAPKDHSYMNRYKHSVQGRRALADKGDIRRFGKPYRPPTYVNRGGNGTGPSRHESLLLERLGDGWVSQFVVLTVGRKNGLPNHYKIGVADPEAMIAVEVDGSSHAHRKEQDERKDAFLQSLGWKVVRLTNREVLSLTDELLDNRLSQCPVDAEVVLVESWKNRTHAHLYDLEVNETHCYFAHWLLVHGC